MRLGKSDVDGMLRGMSSRQWVKWQIYMSLNPLLDERWEWRIAAIVKALWDVALGFNGKTNAATLKDYVSRFGDMEDLTAQKPPEKRTVQEQASYAKQQGNMLKMFAAAMLPEKDRHKILERDGH